MDDVINWVNTNFKWISTLVGLAFVGALAWWKNKFPTRKEYDRLSEEVRREHSALSESVNELNQRVGHVENQLEHIPSKDELHELDNKITGLTESNKAIQATLTQLHTKTDLLLENELREKK